MVRIFYVMSALAVGAGYLGAVSQSAVPSEAGKGPEATQAFEAVLARDPGDLQAQEGEVAASESLALQRRAAGRKDDALRVLLRAQRYVPDNSRLLYDLGVLEDEMKLYVDADRTLGRLGSLGAETPDALYAEARVKLDLGQPGPAEEKMLAYLKLRPNDAGAQYGLGRAYQLQQQFDKACAAFKRSIELQPVQTEAYYELGDMALGQQERKDAVTYFRKVLARDPKHGGALVGMGRACFEQKQYAQAEGFLKQAVAVAPDYQAGHYYLGLTLAREGHKEESQRELQLAIKLAGVQSSKDRGLLLDPTSTYPQ